MATRLIDLADLVNGALVGDGQIEIHDAATLRDASAEQIAFVDSKDKLHLLAKSACGAVLLPLGVDVDQCPAIQVADVHRAFATIVMHFRPPVSQRTRGISPGAYVSPTAQLGSDVEIGPGVTIGDEAIIGNHVRLHANVQVLAGCQLGDHVTVFPNVVLYEHTTVGARSIIHSGAVIGAYGFGYKFENGKHILSAQLGHVEIGSDVEVGACTTIDRGTYGATVIGDGTKIDNLVMIAHNCRLGKHNMICSQVGIAGSTSTGDYVVMAGQVGVRDHVHIGTRAILGAKSGVSQDVPDGVQVLGAPAIPERDEKMILATRIKLPEMRRQLKELQRAVDVLTQAKHGPVSKDAA